MEEEKIEPTAQELEQFEQLVAKLLDKDPDSFVFEVIEDENSLTIVGTGQTELAEASSDWITGSKESLLEYLNLIINFKFLTTEDELKLFEQYWLGDENARLQLGEACLLLVVLIAERYQGQGLSIIDLIQEGNRGLLEAIEQFNLGIGFRFRTYAAWHIDQAINQALKQIHQRKDQENLKLKQEIVRTINTPDKSIPDNLTLEETDRISE